MLEEDENNQEKLIEVDRSQFKALDSVTISLEVNL